MPAISLLFISLFATITTSSETPKKGRFDGQQQITFTKKFNL